MDRYDQEIERLTKLCAAQPHNADGILGIAWRYGSNHSPLFNSCAAELDQMGAGDCGCLTEVHGNQFAFANAPTKELTTAIRADDRLPSYSSRITVEHLPIFAEWQRKLDLELGRTPPPLLETVTG